MSDTPRVDPTFPGPRIEPRIDTTGTVTLHLHEPDTATLVVRGALTESTVEHTRTALRLLGADVTGVTVDLSGVRRVSMAGLAVLVAAEHRLRAAGHHLVVVAPAGCPAHAALREQNLHHVLDVRAEAPRPAKA